jgi:citrate synthase
MENATYSKGLEGVVAGESAICKIDGEAGKLCYRGYSIEDLALHSDFEEVVYLLLNEKLPSASEKEEFVKSMRKSRALHPAIIEMIKRFPKDGEPMELLQSAIAYLSGYVEHKIRHSATCNCRITLHQVVQLASVVATYYRVRNGLDYVEPRSDISHGANFLYMMTGEPPDAREGEIMDACLVLHAEHGFNASTFTARVVASTLSTCYCSISAAIGALYGSLHGGANERVLDTVEEIGSPENVGPWLERAFERAYKIMGMGHRVYKVKDPRAVIMEGFLEELSKKKKDDNNYKILKNLEELAGERFAEKGKKVYPNVDFFSGSVYRLLGIPSYLFTPIFAIARVSGWLAHVLEQRVDNRIFRPKSIYTGPEGLEYVPLEKRA